MYPRRRRWTRVVGVLLVIAVLAAAAFGAWWWLTQRDDAPSGGSASPTKSCRTPTPSLPKSIPPVAHVDVDVANGTDTSGLAIKTADALTRRGFMVVGIGNTDRPVKSGVAQVRYAKPQYAAAIRLASYLPGSELVLAEILKGGAVELWIGPDFGKVASGKDADVTAVALPPVTPICHKP